MFISCPNNLGLFGLFAINKYTSLIIAIRFLTSCTLHEAAIDKLRQCEKQRVYNARGDDYLIFSCTTAIADDIAALILVGS